MITEQKEIKFWKWLKNKLKNEKVDFQRIENTTGGGVPDLNACFRGTEAWIELKVHVKGNVVLRKEQYAWIYRRFIHEGNVMVIALNPVDNTVEFYTQPFTVRKWGNNGKYVAVTSEADSCYEKTVSNELLLRTIFGHK